MNLDIEIFMELTKNENEHDVEKLEKAVKLYDGDFFEEYPYESMLENEREQIRQIFVKANQILAKHYFQENNYQKCFEHYERILDRDPYQEDVYLDYLEVLFPKQIKWQMAWSSFLQMRWESQ